MHSSRFRLATISFLAVTPMTVAVGQSSVAISPFVSYVPSAASNPLAGFALTFGGTTGLALRAGADMSLSNPDLVDSSAIGVNRYRPWSADADAMLYLGGLGGGATVFSRALAPYVFAGIGLMGGDSSGVNVVHNGWSYGAGATIPLGLDADVFGEARWRMTKYVMPTSNNAPDSRSELRFGLSFHVGGSSPQRRPRGYRDDDYDDRVVEVAPAQQPVIVQQAPQPQTVVVMQPAPQPVVIVQPDPEPQTQINVNLPGSVVWGSRRRHRDRQTVIVTQPQQQVIVRPQQTILGRMGIGARRVETTTATTTTQRASCTTQNSRRRSSRTVCVTQ
ncbi:MAG TPA: hypothetical protein VKH19_02825 [Gemmatimonadaceae bacterium]|nr:hypothetical protein [Gemmatimonadaceae bacterium]